MGLATEELAARSGPGIGGFLNVTFGNAAELIIAIFLLAEGLQEVVKASIIGSILGNLLLVLGLSMFVGGIGRKKQVFNRTAANAQATMLFLAVAALIMPAIYALVARRGAAADRRRDRQLRLGPRGALHRRGDRPGLHLPGGARLLAPHPQGPLQPGRQRRRGWRRSRRGTAMATYGWSVKQVDHDARGRRRRRRPGLRDPRRLDLRGVGVDRHLGVLRRDHHRRRGGQRGRALGRGARRARRTRWTSP